MYSRCILLCAQVFSSIVCQNWVHIWLLAMLHAMSSAFYNCTAPPYVLDKRYCVIWLVCIFFCFYHEKSRRRPTYLPCHSGDLSSYYQSDLRGLQSARHRGKIESGPECFHISVRAVVLHYYLLLQLAAVSLQTSAWHKYSSHSLLLYLLEFIYNV